VAPLTSSTSAPPKMEVKPTKPMIVNAPPKKHMQIAPETPKLNGSKPMQVTGFITKSGNIYEIEDKRGSIGSIEGRQADEGQIVCNYGNVVIYSDVPCDKVRNVRVGEVKPLKQDPLEADNTEKNPAEGEQQSQELQPAEQQQQQAVAEDQNQDLDQEQDRTRSSPIIPGVSRRTTAADAVAARSSSSSSSKGCSSNVAGDSSNVAAMATATATTTCDVAAMATATTTTTTGTASSRDVAAPTTTTTTGDASSTTTATASDNSNAASSNVAVPTATSIVSSNSDVAFARAITEWVKEKRVKAASDLLRPTYNLRPLSPKLPE